MRFDYDNGVKYKSIFHLTGYKPFVEACIDAGQKTEALKYIPKLADPRERSEVHFSLKFHLILFHLVFR